MARERPRRSYDPDSAEGADEAAACPDKSKAEGSRSSEDSRALTD